jgi:dTMP kinase
MGQSNNLFVIEGSDGTGKHTQFILLTERLRKAGYDVVTFEFPRYDQASSHFIRKYLADRYGDAKTVGPYAASLFYALDRYEAAPAIRAALRTGKIVLIDRYTGSNLAHQGGKFDHADDRKGFYLWLDSLEHQILGIPRPNRSFVLYASPEITAKLLTGRKEPKPGVQHDIHESDREHLASTIAAYDELCALFAQDFHRVDCVRNNQLLGKSEVNDLIWSGLQPLLPTPASTHQKVYTSPADKAKTLRKTTAVSRSSNNDVTVALTAVSSLVINCLILNNLRVRVASTNQYYVPPKLPEEVAKQYRQTMDKLIQTYQQQAANWPQFAAVLPMAHQHNVTIQGSVAELKAAIIELVANPLSELQNAGQQLFEQLYKLIPSGLPEDLVTIPLSIVEQRRQQIATATQLANEQLANNFGNTNQSVQLVSATPRNELELLPQLLYSASSCSLAEITSQIDRWSYQEKSERFRQLLTGASSTELEQAVYIFDVLAPLSEVIQLKQYLNKDVSIYLQPLTPRYGFEVPTELNDPELSDLFETCFDTSLAVASQLQSTPMEAYAVLQGHKVRARLKISASLLRNGTSSPNNGLYVQIMDQVREIHPLLGSILLPDSQG